MVLIKIIDPPFSSIMWDHETRFSRQSLTSTVRVTQNWSLLRRPKFSRRLPVSTIYKDTSSGLYLSLFLLRFGKYVDSVRVPKWRFPHQKSGYSFYQNGSFRIRKSGYSFLKNGGFRIRKSGFSFYKNGGFRIRKSGYSFYQNVHALLAVLQFFFKPNFLKKK